MSKTKGEIHRQAKIDAGLFKCVCQTSKLQTEQKFQGISSNISANNYRLACSRNLLALKIRPIYKQWDFPILIMFIKTIW